MRTVTLTVALRKSKSKFSFIIKNIYFNYIND